MSPRFEQLTPRELEVLGEVALGLTNREIAHEFTVSVATVKTHVKRLIAKLGVRNRVQLAVLAHQAGLLATGESGPP